MSASPKIGGKATGGENLSLQKNNADEDKGEKVHIRETFEDSDSDSDLGERIRRLEGFGDIGQGSSKNIDGDVHQIWCLESNPPTLDPKQVISEDMKLMNAEGSTLETDKQLVSLGNQKPIEMDFSDEAIVNTQESTVAEEEITEQDGLPTSMGSCICEVIKNDNLKQQKTRRSERLKKDITKTTQENCGRMARKRNLEGIYAEVDRMMHVNGVNTMLKVASDLLLPQRPPEDQCKRLKQDDSHDGEDQNH